MAKLTSRAVIALAFLVVLSHSACDFECSNVGIGLCGGACAIAPASGGYHLMMAYSDCRNGFSTVVPGICSTSINSDPVSCGQGTFYGDHCLNADVITYFLPTLPTTVDVFVTNTIIHDGNIEDLSCGNPISDACDGGPGICHSTISLSSCTMQSAVPSGGPTLEPTYIITYTPTGRPSGTYSAFHPASSTSFSPTGSPSHPASSNPSLRGSPTHAVFSSSSPTGAPSSNVSESNDRLSTGNPSGAPTVSFKIRGEEISTSTPSSIPSADPSLSSAAPSIVSDDRAMCMIAEAAALNEKNLSWQCTQYQPNVPICGSGDGPDSEGWEGVTCDSDGHVTGIAVSNTEATGSVSSYIGMLKKLESQSLTSCSLHGVIPPEIGSLTSLQTLKLNSNSLTNSIGRWLGDLTQLTSLDLSSNQLDSSIPLEIRSLSNVVEVSLFENSLTGSIPSMTTLNSMKKLDLSDNKLTGSAMKLCGLTSLQVLDVSKNSLTGQLPGCLGELTLLTHFNFGNNNLQGTLPHEIGALLQLSKLILSGNSMTSTVPDTYKNLTMLTSLELSSNAVSGTISSVVFSLRSLTKLSLDNNLLRGLIPGDLSLLSALKSLSLKSNGFSGVVPSTLCELHHLTYLNIANNPSLTEYPECLRAVDVLEHSFPTNTPTGRPTASPTTPACLIFHMVDTFGDGWNTAQLHVVDNLGNYETHRPTAESGYNSMVEYCIHPTAAAHGVLVTAGVLGVAVMQPWENYWTVTVPGGSTSIGVTNSYMTFRLVGLPGSYEFVFNTEHYSLSNSPQCLECKDIFHEPNLGPGGFHLSAEASGEGKEGPGKYDANRRGDILQRTFGQSDNILRTYSGEDVVAVEASYHLFAENNMWNSLDGYGTTFDVSSVDGKHLLFQGRPCGSVGEHDHCDIAALPEGLYTWRVTGAHHNDSSNIAWEFCGVQGGVMTEVGFELDGSGMCYPLWTGLVSSGNDSYANYEEMVGPGPLNAETYIFSSTDKGIGAQMFASSSSAHVAGFGKKWSVSGYVGVKTANGAYLTADDISLFRSAVTNTLNIGSLHHDISLTDVTARAASYGSGRIGRDEGYQFVDFVAYIRPESFGFDSTKADSSGADYLKESLEDYLERIVQSGIFLYQLKILNQGLMGDLPYTAGDININVDSINMVVSLTSSPPIKSFGHSTSFSNDFTILYILAASVGSLLLAVIGLECFFYKKLREKSSAMGEAVGNVGKQILKDVEDSPKLGTLDRKLYADREITDKIAEDGNLERKVFTRSIAVTGPVISRSQSSFHGDELSSLSTNSSVAPPPSLISIAGRETRRFKKPAVYGAPVSLPSLSSLPNRSEAVLQERIDHDDLTGYRRNMTVDM